MSRVLVLRSPFAIREDPFSFSSSAMQPAHVTMSSKALGDFTTQIREIEPGTRAPISTGHTPPLVWITTGRPAKW